MSGCSLVLIFAAAIVSSHLAAGQMINCTAVPSMSGRIQPDGRIRVELGNVVYEIDDEIFNGIFSAFLAENSTKTEMGMTGNESTTMKTIVVTRPPINSGSIGMKPLAPVLLASAYSLINLLQYNVLAY